MGSGLQDVWRKVFWVVTLVCIFLERAHNMTPILDYKAVEDVHVKWLLIKVAVAIALPYVRRMLTGIGNANAVTMSIHTAMVSTDYVRLFNSKIVHVFGRHSCRYHIGTCLHAFTQGINSRDD